MSRSYVDTRRTSLCHWRQGLTDPYRASTSSTDQQIRNTSRKDHLQVRNTFPPQQPPVPESLQVLSTCGSHRTEPKQRGAQLGLQTLPALSPRWSPWGGHCDGPSTSTSGQLPLHYQAGKCCRHGDIADVPDISEDFPCFKLSLKIQFPGIHKLVLVGFFL